ncbi:DUF2510 domain-containing protein [Herbiconiux liukaitaii]|uniref:DUF2510 domain-containing protein n=1 Tax=Herbiconiux liukaitaii TaxID=3342799 RepID=UPI0035B82E4D
MSAAPGWYDAGTPGRLRWWDGTQWTPHESDVPAKVIVAGWYPTPTGQLRWWDGAHWTGMRVKNGAPGIDWATTEQPAISFAFGGIWLALSGLQFAIGAVTSYVSPNGIATLLLAALWIAIGIQGARVRGIPTPGGEPTVIDAVRPLPGEQEAPGAGWYPIAPRVTRWWTGARWAEYVATATGIRPSFHGARSFRIYLVTVWSVLALGALGLLAGVLLLTLGSPDPDDYLAGALGIGLIVGGIILALLGVVLLAVSRLSRRVLIVPERRPGL